MKVKPKRQDYPSSIPTSPIQPAELKTIASDKLLVAMAQMLGVREPEIKDKLRIPSGKLEYYFSYQPDTIVYATDHKKMIGVIQQLGESSSPPTNLPDYGIAFYWKGDAFYLLLVDTTRGLVFLTECASRNRTPSTKPGADIIKELDQLLAVKKEPAQIAIYREGTIEII